MRRSRPPSTSSPTRSPPGTTVVVDSIKFALWLVSKALFALYRAFRDVLMLRAYATPFTDQLLGNFGGLAASSLWQSPGNPPPGTYPHEEIADEREAVRELVRADARADRPA